MKTTIYHGKTSTNNYAKGMINWTIMVIFCLFSFASVIMTRVTVVEGIKYVLYQIVCVYFIGMFLARLLDISMATEYQQFAINYAIGYAIQVVNWYISMATYGSSSQLLLYVLEIIVISTVSIFIHKDYHTNYRDIETKVIVCLFVFIILFVGMRFFTTLGYNLLPYGNIVNNNFIHDDLSWEIIQSIATKHSFPVDDMKWLGDRLYYHYFGYVCNGVMSNVTGISCAKLVTSLTFINEGIFFATSVISFFQFITDKDGLCCFGAVLLTFTSGVEMYSIVTWSFHTLAIPLGVDIGIAYMMISIGIIIFCERNSIYQYGYMLLFFITFAMSTGTKGPCAMTSILPILMFCILTYMKGERRILLLGLEAIFSFCLVYIFVDSGILDMEYMSVQSGSNTDMIVRLFSPLEKYPLAEICGATSKYGGVISKIFLLIRYVFYSNPAIVVILTVVLLISSISNIKMDKYLWLLLSGYLLGYFFVSIVSQAGCSEMYFTFSSFPFGVGLIVLLLSYFDTIKYKLFPVVICGAFFAIGISCWFGSIRPTFMKGYHNLVHNDHNEISINEARTYRKSIYEACEWLRINSSYGDIVISNTVIDDNYAGFDITSFTERRQWLEFSKYTGTHLDELRNKREDFINYYCTKNPTFIDKIKKDGVKYWINVKGIQYDIELKEIKNMNLVYENEEVQIAELLID